MADIINLDICIRQGAEYRAEYRRVKARYVFKAVIAGDSGVSAPTWPTGVDDTIADSGVTWVNIGLYDDNAFPQVDVWLPSFTYARRAKVVTPVEAVDITGYTGVFELRAEVGAVDPALYSGTVSIGVATNGEFAMIIPTADTKLLTTRSGVYDLELVNGSAEVDFVIRGDYELIREVTTV